MRRFVIWIVAGALAGCGGPAPDTSAVPTPSIAASTPKTQLDPPDFAHFSRLGILRQSDAVRVGMSYEDALGVFPPPLGSNTNSDLPPSIPPPYEARGWQTKADAFGAILYKGRVAAAVYEVDRTTDDRVEELVREHQQVYGLPSNVLDGTFVRYWFWQSGKDPGDQMLMVSATEIQPSKFNLTVAAGTLPVMDALGMVPDAAARDQRAAEKLIRKQRSGGKTNPTNSSNRAAG